MHINKLPIHLFGHLFKIFITFAIVLQRERMVSFYRCNVELQHISHVQRKEGSDGGEEKGVRHVGDEQPPKRTGR